MDPISVKYRSIANEMVESSSQTSEITTHNVFQPGNEQNRVLVDRIVDELVLAGSHIDGMEHLEELYGLAQSGKSTLILMEHYSNFDIPCFYYLLDKQDPQRKVSSSICSMAGMKLNMDSKFVLAFTEAYTRIVIYPSRSLASIRDAVTLAQEIKRSTTINWAAMREMMRQKHSGHIILVFPSGTRYRPGQEDTKRVLKEVDGYIKGFHYMVLVGIAGNVLRLSESGDMSQDLATQDVVIYSVSPVMSCHDYRKHAKAAWESGNVLSGKQAVADAVRSDLNRYHEQAKALREPLLLHKKAQ